MISKVSLGENYNLIIDPRMQHVTLNEMDGASYNYIFNPVYYSQAPSPLDHENGIKSRKELN